MARIASLRETPGRPDRTSRAISTDIDALCTGTRQFRCTDERQLALIRNS
jgi:hypothetical protein